MSLPQAVSFLRVRDQATRIGQELSKQRANENNDPVGERPPPRGQRAPFRNRPSHYQPMPKAANATSGMGGVADERVRDDVARTVNEHASQAVVTDADPQVMPASIEDLFEDEVSVRIGDDELN